MSRIYKIQGLQLCNFIAEKKTEPGDDTSNGPTNYWVEFSHPSIQELALFAKFKTFDEVRLLMQKVEEKTEIRFEIIKR